MRVVSHYGPPWSITGSKTKLAKESQFRQFTQQGHKFAKLCESKWLGEQVRRVCLAGNPLEVNDTTKSQITNEFGSSKNMFSFLESDGVERQIDNALVVGGHASRTEKREMEVEKEVAKEQDLLSGGTHRKVLGLGAGHRD